MSYYLVAALMEWGGEDKYLGMIIWLIRFTLRGRCGPSQLAELVHLTISFAYGAPKGHLTRMPLPDLSHWLVRTKNKGRVLLLWFIPKEGPRNHGLFTLGARSLSEGCSPLKVLCWGHEWGHAWCSGESWSQGVLQPPISESCDGEGGWWTSQTPGPPLGLLAIGPGISSLSYPL